MTERRGLTVAVLAVVAGAGLVLFGASRVWWVEVVSRPAPLLPEEIAHTGASLAPLLPALGLVALAGAGGLLATRGVTRRLVGALLGVVAVAAAVAVVGALSGARPLWPAACLLGAVLIGAAGVLTVRYGGRWPEMGARYRRNVPYASSGEGGQGAERAGYAAPTADDGSVSAPARLSAAELWDAVDRGDDPTRG
jgi:Tryptophan-associated transmembrane protein (Trp_oprn_chp).